MRVSSILILALVLSCALAQVKQSEADVIMQSQQASMAYLNQLIAQLEQAKKDGSDVSLQIDFKKQIKQQKVEVKDRKERIKNKIQEAKCKRHITKLTKAIEAQKKKPVVDQKKIDRMAKRKEWWIIRHEQARLREHKRLQKRIDRFHKDKVRLDERAKFCQVHFHQRGCTKFLKRYQKDVRTVRHSRDVKMQIVKKITQARQKHVKTFKNNKNIQVKKAMIQLRNDQKIKRLIALRDRLNKRLQDLAEREQGANLKRQEKSIMDRIERINKRIGELRTYTKTIKVVRSTGPGKCSTCEMKILQLLNKIYTATVKEPLPSDSTTTTRTIVVKGTGPRGRYVKRQGTRKAWRNVRVAKNYSWNTTQTRMRKHRVRKSFRVQKPKEWDTMETKKVPYTYTATERVPTKRFHWVNHRQLQKYMKSEQRTRKVKAVRLVDKKVLISVPRKFRNQELIQNADGSFTWKDLGYETRMCPVWVTKKFPQTYVKDQAYTVQVPAQRYITVRKWEPYMSMDVRKVQRIGYKTVQYKKHHKGTQWVNEMRMVDEYRPEKYTVTHHGTRYENQRQQYDQKYEYNQWQEEPEMKSPGRPRYTRPYAPRRR